MNAKQIGSHLILQAFKMVEYDKVFAQRLPQSEDVDAGCRASMPASTSSDCGNRCANTLSYSTILTACSM
ncbi:hypothetical protein, partial [Mesorhizobium sp. M7A.F.Ca.CA.002.06.1.1]|uniref:hypothetical protein n=1 Tax=Mesorhizobium sp. M7A.F.Ca.CA.002.06.1.1 TaxID=2496705 RepID=UPI0019D1A23D